VLYKLQLLLETGGTNAATIVSNSGFSTLEFISAHQMWMSSVNIKSTLLGITASI